MQQRRLRLAALLLAGSVAAALVVGSLHMQVRPRAVLCDQRLPGARERAGSAARRNVGVHGDATGAGRARWSVKCAGAGDHTPCNSRAPVRTRHARRALLRVLTRLCCLPPPAPAGRPRAASALLACRARSAAHGAVSGFCGVGLRVSAVRHRRRSRAGGALLVQPAGDAGGAASADAGGGAKGRGCPCPGAKGWR